MAITLRPDSRPGCRRGTVEEESRARTTGCRRGRVTGRSYRVGKASPNYKFEKRRRELEKKKKKEEKRARKQQGAPEPEEPGPGGSEP